MAVLSQFIILAPPLVIAVVLHEIAHGYVAYLLGDPTAKNLGRLSLNPIRHIDPMMTIVLPTLLVLFHSPVLFGGAKPVPINPLYFKNPRRGLVLVAVAGPLTNIVLALISFGLIAVVNRMHLIQKSLPPEVLQLLLLWGLFGMLTNIVLALFNLIPIPPLDGGKIAVGLLPKSLAIMLARLESIGLFIVFALLASGAVSSYLEPAIELATRKVCVELYGEAECPLLGKAMANENFSTGGKNQTEQ